MYKRKATHSIDIISDEVYTALTKSAGERKLSTRAFVNEILQNVTKANDVFKKTFPHLKTVTIKDNSAYIDDEKRDKTSRVKLKDGKLNCNICDKHICDHITFIIGYPEFWKMTESS